MLKKAATQLQWILPILFLTLLLGCFSANQRNYGAISLSRFQSISTADTGNVKLNINVATLSQLDALPGIGPSLAQSILDYREANGPFRSVEELLNVKGIGEKKLETILDYITIGE